MAKILDFNSYRRPTLLLRMKDDAMTKLHVTTPTLDLVDEVRANLPEIQAALNSDATASRAIYELAAKLLNCNMNGVTITAEELATTYEMNLEDMTIFFSAYMEFLGDIKNAKN